MPANAKLRKLIENTHMVMASYRHGHYTDVNAIIDQLVSVCNAIETSNEEQTKEDEGLIVNLLLMRLMCLGPYHPEYRAESFIYYAALQEDKTLLKFFFADPRFRLSPLNKAQLMIATHETKTTVLQLVVLTCGYLFPLLWQSLPKDDDIKINFFRKYLLQLLSTINYNNPSYQMTYQMVIKYLMQNESRAYSEFLEFHNDRTQNSKNWLLRHLDFNIREEQHPENLKWLMHLLSLQTEETRTPLENEIIDTLIKYFETSDTFGTSRGAENFTLTDSTIRNLLFAANSHLSREAKIKLFLHHNTKNSSLAYQLERVDPDLFLELWQIMTLEERCILQRESYSSTFNLLVTTAAHNHAACYKAVLENLRFPNDQLLHQALSQGISKPLLAIETDGIFALTHPIEDRSILPSAARVDLNAVEAAFIFSPLAFSHLTERSTSDSNMINAIPDFLKRDHLREVITLLKLKLGHLFSEPAKILCAILDKDEKSLAKIKDPRSWEIYLKFLFNPKDTATLLAFLIKNKSPAALKQQILEVISLKTPSKDLSNYIQKLASTEFAASFVSVCLLFSHLSKNSSYNINTISSLEWSFYLEILYRREHADIIYRLLVPSITRSPFFQKNNADLFEALQGYVNTDPITLNKLVAQQVVQYLMSSEIEDYEKRTTGAQDLALCVLRNLDSDEALFIEEVTQVLIVREQRLLLEKPINLYVNSPSKATNVLFESVINLFNKNQATNSTNAELRTFLVDHQNNLNPWIILHKLILIELSTHAANTGHYEKVKHWAAHTLYQNIKNDGSLNLLRNLPPFVASSSSWNRGGRIPSTILGKCANPTEGVIEAYDEFLTTRKAALATVSGEPSHKVEFDFVNEMIRIRDGFKMEESITPTAAKKTIRFWG